MNVKHAIVVELGLALAELELHLFSDHCHTSPDAVCQVHDLLLVQAAREAAQLGRHEGRGLQPQVAHVWQDTFGFLVAFGDHSG